MSEVRQKRVQRADPTVDTLRSVYISNVSFTKHTLGKPVQVFREISLLILPTSACHAWVLCTMQFNVAENQIFCYARTSSLHVFCSITYQTSDYKSKK